MSRWSVQVSAKQLQTESGYAMEGEGTHKVNKLVSSNRVRYSLKSVAV